jgi:hypothetical protein
MQPKPPPIKQPEIFRFILVNRADRRTGALD